MVLVRECRVGITVSWLTSAGVACKNSIKMSVDKEFAWYSASHGSDEMEQREVWQDKGNKSLDNGKMA